VLVDLLEVPCGRTWKTPRAFGFALTDNVQWATYTDDCNLEINEDAGIICDERFFEKKIVDDNVQAAMGDGGYGATHSLE
jgi:hypothetical protein